MKYVVPLSESELVTLRSMYENHSSRRVRLRALALVLSHEGYPIQEIAAICGVSRQSVSSWIEAWQKEGLGGLYDEPREGRPLKLSREDEEFIHKHLGDEPRKVKRVLALLEEKRGVQVSEWTVKRALRKAKLRWKRVRKSLRSKRDEHKFQRARERINRLESRRVEGAVDLFYYDEAGFCLDPCIPYAWQPVGEWVKLPACTTKRSRINVLAFMGKDNQLIPVTVKEGGVDAKAVCACFDAMSTGLTRKTFVIIDNAPVHKSRAFLANLPKWAKRGLCLKFLPSYSPELNLIEILWRKIKYECLPLSAYLSFALLQEALDHILKSFGEEFAINFST